MLENFYNWTHANTALHFWDWFALAVAIVVVIVLIVHHKNQKKRDDEILSAQQETLTNLDTVLAADGLQNTTQVLTDAAKKAEIQWPKEEQEQEEK